MSGIVVNLWRNSEAVAAQETTPHKGMWGCIRTWYRGCMWGRYFGGLSKKLSTIFNFVWKVWITLIFSLTKKVKELSRSRIFYLIPHLGMAMGVHVGMVWGMTPPIKGTGAGTGTGSGVKRRDFFHDHIEPKQGIKCF